MVSCGGSVGSTLRARGWTPHNREDGGLFTAVATLGIIGSASAGCACKSKFERTKPKKEASAMLTPVCGAIFIAGYLIQPSSRARLMKAVDRKMIVMVIGRMTRMHHNQKLMMNVHKGRPLRNRPASVERLAHARLFARGPRSVFWCEIILLLERRNGVSEDPSALVYNAHARTAQPIGVPRQVLFAYNPVHI